MGILRTLTACVAPARGLVLIAALAMLATPASAGDEVDDSAPYITVENGELVTRYPARAHDETNEKVAASPDEEEARAAPAVLAVVLCLGAAVVLLRRALASRADRQESAQ